MAVTAAAQQRHILRRRRLAVRQPGLGLNKFRDIAVGGTFLPGDLWPNGDDAPITFATKIKITGAAADGIIFESGGTTGVKLAITLGSLYFAAGTAAGANGVDDSIALAWLDEAGGPEHHLAVAMNPGAGTARVYDNGQIIMRMDSGQTWASGWGATNTGKVGGEGGALSTLRGQSITTDATDFEITAPLSIYNGQLPGLY